MAASVLSLDCDEDRDAFAAFSLRARLESFNFSAIYKCMTKLTWTYKQSKGTGTYLSPCGRRTFETSMQLCETLDRFALPAIGNRRGIIPSSSRLTAATRALPTLSTATTTAMYSHPSLSLATSIEAQEQDELDRKLRNNIVALLFHKVHGERRRRNSKKDGEKETTQKKGKGKDETSSDRRSTRRREVKTSAVAVEAQGECIKDTTKRKTSKLAAASVASVTTFEPGADMYLKGRKTRKIGSRSRGNGISTNNSEHHGFAVDADQMPHPKKNVETVRQMQLPRVQPLEEDEAGEGGCATLTNDDKFLLSTNHCLLLYGYGSKRDLLNSFGNDVLSKDGDVLAIDGYDRDVRIDGILDMLVDLFLDKKEPDGDKQVYEMSSTTSNTAAADGGRHQHALVKRAVAIAQKLSSVRTCPLYLILHNIDGIGLRNRVAQQALAALVVHSNTTTSNNNGSNNGNNGKNASSPTTPIRAVQLVASVDHVNATAHLWDVESWSNLNWMWKEVCTYQPYFEEIKVGMDETLCKSNNKTRSRSNQLLLAKNGGDIGSLQSVLFSLAKRHAETLQTLATLQLEESSFSFACSSSSAIDSNKVSAGRIRKRKQQQRRTVDYTSLRQQCQHNMIASNDSLLRDFVTELIDHGIVERFVDDITATEKVFIPYSHEMLHEIVAFQIAN